MSKIELLAKIELLNKYEAMMEEIKAEADSIRNSIKAEMEAREVEELIAGQYIVRYTSVLSNRFDSTAFKKVITVRIPSSFILGLAESFVKKEISLAELILMLQTTSKY